MIASFEKWLSQGSNELNYRASITPYYGINRFLANWIFNVLGSVFEVLASRKRKNKYITKVRSMSTPYGQKVEKQVSFAKFFH